jgi:hypothetical protein
VKSVSIMDFIEKIIEKNIILTILRKMKFWLLNNEFYKN